MHFVVTGTDGFAAGHIAEGLVGLGHRVSAVSRRPQPREITNCAIFRADLKHGTDDLPDDPDVIVHAAAQSHPVGPSIMDYVEDNVLATAEICAYARRTGARGIIFLSSISVFGTVSTPTLDEATVCVDPDNYGLSKLLCERLLAEVAETVPSISLRLPGIVGDGAGNVWLAEVVRKFRAGREVVIYNPDAPFNNVVHVTDLVQFVETLGQARLSGAEILVLGADLPISIARVVDLVKRHCRSRSAVTVDGSVIRTAFTLDCGRAKSHFGYRPKSTERIVELASSEIH